MVYSKGWLPLGDITLYYPFSVKSTPAMVQLTYNSFIGRNICINVYLLWMHAFLSLPSKNNTHIYIMGWKRLRDRGGKNHPLEFAGHKLLRFFSSLLSVFLFLWWPFSNNKTTIPSYHKTWWKSWFNVLYVSVLFVFLTHPVYKQINSLGTHNRISKSNGVLGVGNHNFCYNDILIHVIIKIIFFLNIRLETVDNGFRMNTSFIVTARKYFRGIVYFYIINNFSECIKNLIETLW